MAELTQRWIRGENSDPNNQRNKPKLKVRAGGLVGRKQGPCIDDVRSKAEADPKEFVQFLQEVTDRKPGEDRLSFMTIGSIRHAQEKLGDVMVEVYDRTSKRTVSTSAFSILTSTLLASGVNDAFQEVATIGEFLVQDFNDPKKISTFPGILPEDDEVAEVPEMGPFPEMGAGEEKYQISHLRNGRQISITQEMIDENDVAGIVGRIDWLGRRAAYLIERQTLRRVTDVFGSGSSPARPFVLTLDGAGRALYRTNNTAPFVRLPSAAQSPNAAAGNRLTGNALQNSSDLAKARGQLAAMRLPMGGKGDGGRIAIPISQSGLLVPDNLVDTADQILGSRFTPGVENELNNWGPSGRWRPTPITSPLLDDISTTAWYLGMFSMQFWRKWKLRPEIVTLSGSGQPIFLTHRIGYMSRIAWDMEVGARTYEHVIQNLAASTPPSV